MATPCKLRRFREAASQNCVDAIPRSKRRSNLLRRRGHIKERHPGVKTASSSPRLFWRVRLSEVFYLKPILRRPQFAFETRCLDHYVVRIKLSSESDLVRPGGLWTNSLEEPRYEKSLPMRRVDSLGLSWLRSGFGAGHGRRRCAAPRYSDSGVAAGGGESFVRTCEHAGARAAAGDRVL
jgi:hypothetical protein